jgi:PadR family transcriptional regulator PadR
VQYIKERSKELLQVEEGSLYPALQRLLKERQVEAKWEISASNRRVRTYRVTAAGRRHLEREVSSFERMLRASVWSEVADRAALYALGNGKVRGCWSA